METYIYFAYAGAASRLLPLGVAAAHWKTLERAARLLAAVVALSLAGDAVMFVIGRIYRVNNLWVSHLLIGLQTPLLLLALREWAGNDQLRRFLTIGAIVAVAGWLNLTVTIESPDRFARVTGPLQAGLLCLAAITVLANRGLSGEGALGRASWFWVCLAILLVYGLTAVHRPLLDLFTARGVTSIPAFTVLKALAVLQVIANLMYARAFLLGRSAEATPAPAPA